MKVGEGLNLLVNIGLSDILKLKWWKKMLTPLSFSTSSRIVFIRKSLDLLVYIRYSL